jgi:hypothetical protein
MLSFSLANERSIAQSIHIAAVFVLLIGSFIGVIIPIIFSSTPSRLMANAFFALKHFGTGVILATA